MFAIIALTACGIASRKTGNGDTPGQMAVPEKTEFAIGETWTVDGQWSLTVLGVTETTDRNEFSEKTPAAVYIVDYVYIG